MPLRILLTGFGPFPGAPYNPTPALATRLARLRRPALEGVERIAHVFEVSYRAVDRELPALLARHRPDALLMFGLAMRTPHLRVETRARNAVTRLWPDAAGAILQHSAIAPGEDARAFDPRKCERLMRAARASGVDTRLSRDAGRYLCNYLAWRALASVAQTGAPRLAAFVHVPLVARPGMREPRAQALTADQLARAGAAVLMEVVRQARQARLPTSR